MGGVQGSPMRADVGNPLKMRFVEGIGWVMEGEELPEPPAPLPPPPTGVGLRPADKPQAPAPALTAVDRLCVPPGLHFQAGAGRRAAKWAAESAAPGPAPAPAAPAEPEVTGEAAGGSACEDGPANFQEEEERELSEELPDGPPLRPSLLELHAGVTELHERLDMAELRTDLLVALRGGPEALVAALRRHGGGCGWASAAALQPLADALWECTFEGAAALRAAAAGCVEAVLGLARWHEDSPGIQGAACGVLLNVALWGPGLGIIGSSGTVEEVVSMMHRHSGHAQVLELGCQVLCLLAYAPELRPLVLRAAGGRGGAAELVAAASGGAAHAHARLWGGRLQTLLSQ